LTLNPLAALELDALRETANVATARAARALSELLGRNVWMSQPVVRWTPGPWTRDDDDHAAQTVVVAAGVRGGFSGSILFMMTGATAVDLCQILLGTESPPALRDPLVRSCLLETATILGDSFLTALSSLTGVAFRLSVPRFGLAPEPSLWQELHDSGQWPALGLGIETVLDIGDDRRVLPCRLVLLGSHGTFASVLDELQEWC
jgi:chemotaxis protein CheC